MDSIPDPTKWVELFANHGVSIAITAIVVMMSTWGVYFVVSRLFGKDGLVPWAFEQVFGDEGYIAAVVSDHKQFIQGVQENTSQAKDMVKGALALGEVHMNNQRKTHDVITACGKEFCDAVMIAAERLNVRDDIAPHIQSIKKKLDEANDG